MKKKAPKGSTRKHASKKHHATRAKHHPKEISGGLMQLAGQPARVVAKHPHHAKPRGLALAPGDVACCAAEALAASLRLAGGSVADADVLALHWLAGGDADTPVSIWAALEAASEFGLGGVRPLSFEEVMPHADDLSKRAVLPGVRPHKTWAGLILGADLPGLHALYDDGEAWWSWGEPYDPADFPGAVIEEAWAVQWQ